jgi:glycosyltransferase involved in cell wall biosynthesis
MIAPARQKTLSVYSPDFDPYTGYGRMTREVIAAGKRRGLYVNAMGTEQTTVVYGDTDADISGPVRASVGGILMGYPTMHQKYGALANLGARMAITMFESTILPPGWVDVLNGCGAVAVPTLMQAELFKKNGVNVPLHVIPLGVSEHYSPRPVDGADDHPLKRYPYKRGFKQRRLHYRRENKQPTTGDPFIFLCWGDRGSRKGWDLAIQAFNMAFKDRNDVKLVIKTRQGGQMPYHINIRGVEVISCDLDEAQMNDLYLRCDAMVFPSRGEGFGLPPREFARTGGPAIVTQWWADHVGRWAYPVRYGMVDAWPGEKDKQNLGKWAEPDVEHLAKQMAHLVNQDARILCRMGERSREWVRVGYDWRHFGDLVMEAWEKI